jgi:hypothetical protein
MCDLSPLNLSGSETMRLDVRYPFESSVCSETRCHIHASGFRSLGCDQLYEVFFLYRSMDADEDEGQPEYLV